MNDPWTLVAMFLALLVTSVWLFALYAYWRRRALTAEWELQLLKNAMNAFAFPPLPKVARVVLTPKKPINYPPCF